MNEQEVFLYTNKYSNSFAGGSLGGRVNYNRNNKYLNTMHLFTCYNVWFLLKYRISHCAMHLVCEYLSIELYLCNYFLLITKLFLQTRAPTFLQ